jgi:phosphoserine phosphatase
VNKIDRFRDMKLGSVSMRTVSLCSSTIAAFFVSVYLAASVAQCADPLPSWNDTHAKQAIVSFVNKVTTAGSPDFVPPAERIATFDNDGTLWGEQPAYVQLLFVFDRVKTLAPQHPEWKTTEPFAGAIQGNLKAVAASGEEGLIKLLAATHAGMTTEEFTEVVEKWIETARHPTTGKRYTEMVYQPMLELLDYLRAHEFKTYIVSGGGTEFMRPWTQQVYGIPPEQVIGSRIETRFEMRDDRPVIVRLPEISFIDDKAGKPIGILTHIGRRPLFAAGNSDGDLQMLQYTTIRRGSDDVTPRFALIIHHTDAKREWAYDRDSHVGQLNTALDEAPQRGWVVASMKDDWKVVYPPRK